VSNAEAIEGEGIAMAFHVVVWSAGRKRGGRKWLACQTVYTPL
jgi:hypothetical protein